MQSNYMNESFSSSNRIKHKVVHYGEVLSIPNCHCGQQLKLKTSWTNDNSGIRYWECAPEKGMEVVGCGFIRWFDPPMCARAMKIIPGFLRRINRNEEDINVLKSKLRARGCVDDNGVDAKMMCNPKSVMVIVVVIVMIVLVLSYIVATFKVGEKMVHRLPFA